MRFIIIIISIFISVTVYAQVTTMFNDTLRPFGSGGDGFSNVIEDSSSYFALSFLNSSIGQYPYLIKINNSGSIIKKKIYTKSNYDYAIYPYNSMILDDNVILFCGQKWGNSLGTLGFIAAINKYTLDTLWTKTYPHPDTLIAQNSSNVFSVLTAIKSTLDGGYILTGNYNKNCITGNIRSFLMKIDSVGEVEWRRVYGDVTSIYNIEVIPWGGYAVLNNFGGRNIVIFDSLGVELWRKKANNYIGLGAMVDLTYNGNNSYVASTAFKYIDNQGNDVYGINVFKINALTKQVMWDKTYKLYNSVECISLHQAIGIETLPNGDIIISGTASHYGHDAVILKLNSNGDSLWCKSYDYHPDNWDCQLNDLIVTDDGGFMGVGFFSDQAGPGWTAWMFKTDANGVVGWETPEAKVKSRKVKVWPNPAINFVNIEFTEKLSQDAELKVYNALGQVVLRKPLNKSEKQISIELDNFKQGLYLFEVIGDNEILGVGRFVKK